jgi:hypothetical protein
VPSPHEILILCGGFESQTLSLCVSVASLQFCHGPYYGSNMPFIIAELHNYTGTRTADCCELFNNMSYATTVFDKPCSCHYSMFRIPLSILPEEQSSNMLILHLPAFQTSLYGNDRADRLSSAAPVGLSTGSWVALTAIQFILRILPQLSVEGSSASAMPVDDDRWQLSSLAESELRSSLSFIIIRLSLIKYP